MSQMSDFAENLVANFLMNNQTATRPTTWFLALFTAAPNDTGGGTEVSGSGYARQAITFGAASGGTVSNTSTHTFTASGGNFGTITHWAIFDAVTAGNMLVYGAATTSRTINSGDSLTVAAAAITVTMQ
jgi:hypothetical protein